MGSYLNPPSTLFRGSLRSKIYVDKSGLIERTNELICTEQKYVCVSRPRRFGKSMAANMLAAYYKRDENKCDQYHGLFEKQDTKICIGQVCRDKTRKLGVGACTCKFEHNVNGCLAMENQIYDFLKQYILDNK